MGAKKRSPSVPTVSVSNSEGVTPVLRVQRVNRKRDFRCVVHSTCDSLGLNFKGQVKREREGAECLP